MADSLVDIANVALSRIGVKDFIDDPNEESAAAEVLEQVGAHCRDLTLERFEWPFASRIVGLAAVSGATRTEWAYVYGAPADMVAARRIWNGSRVDLVEGRIPFAVLPNDAGDGVVICTDESNASLVYTARMATVKLYPPAFVDALAWALAKEFTLALPGKAQLMAAMEQRFEVALAAAKSAVLREQQKGAPAESATIRARS